MFNVLRVTGALTRCRCSDAKNCRALSSGQMRNLLGTNCMSSLLKVLMAIGVMLSFSILKVARRIAEEFWQQGDLEKRVLSAPSNQLMDR